MEHELGNTPFAEKYIADIIFKLEENSHENWLIYLNIP